MLKQMKLREIGAIIRADWKKPNYAAKPYIDAMCQLVNERNDGDEEFACIEGNYWRDSAKEIAARFMANAGTWKGETARAVKAEIRRRLK